jgi:hypothetical protein
MLFSPFSCHLPFLRSKYALQMLPRYSHFSPYMSERHMYVAAKLQIYLKRSEYSPFKYTEHYFWDSFINFKLGFQS